MSNYLASFEFISKGIVISATNSQLTEVFYCPALHTKAVLFRKFMIATRGGIARCGIYAFEINRSLTENNYVPPERPTLAAGTDPETPQGALAIKEYERLLRLHTEWQRAVTIIKDTIWHACNRSDQMLICAGGDDYQSMTIANIWANLAIKYQQPKAQEIALLNMELTMKLIPGISLSDHVIKLTEIFHYLNEFGDGKSETTKVQVFFNTLPSHPIYTAFVTNYDINNIAMNTRNFVQCSQSLLDYQDNQVIHGDHYGTANSAHASQAKGTGPSTEAAVSMDKHQKDMYNVLRQLAQANEKLAQQGGRGQNNEGPRGSRGRGGGCRGHQPAATNTAPLYCSYHTNSTNHTTAQCYRNRRATPRQHAPAHHAHNADEMAVPPDVAGRWAFIPDDN